jgi:hypothetical protein
LEQEHITTIMVNHWYLVEYDLGGWDFYGYAYFDLMMNHTKNIKDVVCGSYDMNLQQVSTEPATIKKLIHFFKDRCKYILFLMFNQEFKWNTK